MEIGPSPPADTVGIAIDLPNAPAELGVRVFDAVGRAIRTLHDGDRVLAHVHVHWDGRDDSGHAVPTGVYIVRVEAVPLSNGRTVHATRTAVIARRR